MRKRILTALLIGVAVMLTGCGNSIPDLTDEQLQAVGEYTAQLLLTHDTNYKSRLVDVETLATEEPIPSPQESLPEKTPEPTGMDPVEDTPVVDMTGSQDAQQENMKLEEAMGLPEQMTLTYNGYDVQAHYSEDGVDDDFFTLDAEAGNQLLVLHFTLENQGEGTETADLINKKMQISVSVNGIDTYSLSTLLNNDLTLYCESLNPGESREVVILAEYEAESLLDVASIGIKVKREEINATIRLQ